MEAVSSGSPFAGPSGDLFVGNLPPTVTKSDLARTLGRYGQLDHLSLAYGPGGGFRGFAFARFTRPEAAAELVNSGGVGPSCQLVMDGRPLRVEWRRPRPVGGGGDNSAIESVPTSTLFPAAPPHPPPLPTCQLQQQQQQLPPWLHARLVEDTERLVDCLLAELRLCNRLAAAAATSHEAAALRGQARDLEARMRARSAELADLTFAGCRLGK